MMEDKKTPNNIFEQFDKPSDRTIGIKVSEAVMASLLNTEKSEKATEEQNQSSAKEAAAEANRFIRKYGRLLSVFSRDSSISFNMKEGIETFAFNFEDFSVEVPLKWFAEKQYTENELLFVNYHERAHFIDMQKNPKAFLDNFDRMRKDAEKIAKEYEKANPGTSVQDIQNYVAKELHDLYNCLDDVYVNSLVEQRVGFFEDGGEGHNSILSLYDKAGYRNPDLTDTPLHQQMIFSLLRDQMVGKDFGESVVDERVRNVLDTKMLGQSSIQKVVDVYLKPKNGIQNDPNTRYTTIRNYIQPLFVELLKEYLDSQQGQPPRSSKSSEGESGDNDGSEGESGDNDGSEDESEDKSGSDTRSILNDGITNDEETMRKILDEMREKEKADNMSEDEYKEYEAKKRQEQFDKDNGIRPEERAAIDDILNSISKPRKEMRSFWAHLIGKSIEYRTRRVGEQTRGKIEIPSVIKHYADIQESMYKGNLEKPRIYSKNETERMVVDQPDTIEVTLLVDCSGSMDSKKVSAARAATALLLYSIKDFNDEIDKIRITTKTKLFVDSDVIHYGSDFAQIKAPERKPAWNEISMKGDAGRIKGVTRIDGNRGGTDDGSPLEAINKHLTNNDINRIKSKKLKKIVFEITDGCPNDAEQTSKAIRRLADDGVIMIGFKIGEDKNEKEIFGSIWNNDNDNVHGVFVGEHIGQLPNLLMKELADSLKDIII